jgi:hypothetical protein
MISLDKIAMSQYVQLGAAGSETIIAAGLPSRNTGILKDDPTRALPVVKNIRVGRSRSVPAMRSVRSSPTDAPPVAIDPTTRSHDPLAIGVGKTPLSTGIDANCVTNKSNVTAVTAAATDERSIVRREFLNRTFEPGRRRIAASPQTATNAKARNYIATRLRPFSFAT